MLPCESASFGRQPHDLGASRLRRALLPDDWGAICIPFKEDTYGEFLKPEWSRVVDAATNGTGKILHHAYEVSLCNLQRWKRRGAIALRPGADGVGISGDSVFLVAGPDAEKELDVKVAMWIRDFAEDLYGPPIPAFVPSERAYKIVARTVGLSPGTIEGLVKRRNRSSY